MNSIRAVIADDEPEAVNVIKALLAQFAPDIELTGIATDGLEAVKIITTTRPDIVFLDIDMPIVNGMQVMEKLAGIGFQVIFTTGSAAYALKALKIQATDYLLKPIDPAEFIVSVSRAREQLSLRLQRPQTGNSRLQFPTQNEIVFLDEMEISHVTGMGSYSHIHTISGEKIMVSKNIGQIEQKLSPDLFFRSHNSHIVNLSFVSKYLHREGYFVEMKNGTLIEVSRRSKEGLLQALAERSK